MGFDYSREQYDRTAAAVGGKDALYCRYFDQQYEMIKLLQPAVVGHFEPHPDLRPRVPVPGSGNRRLMERIRRNLALIRDLDLIMDFNLRSLLKGASEPYISRPILQIARDMGIAVVPGDDSHGLDSVAANMDTGVAILAAMGFDTNWRQPKLLTC